MGTNETKYAALIFDIVQSRRYQSRLNVQKMLIECTKYLNTLFKESIKKDVVPTAGDEFQGLLMNAQVAFLYVRKLQLLIYPIQIRSGIGYGKIKYDIDSWSSPAFDGEAYYYARDAINAIPKEAGNIVFFNTNSKFDKYLNTFYMSNAIMKAKASEVCRWIELLADVICPIKEVKEDPEIYYFIQSLREETGAIWRRRKNLPSYLIKQTSIDNLFAHIQGSPKKQSQKEGVYVDENWNHGMIVILAQAMNTSRQNVTRYINSGHIKQSRSIDKALFELLGEVESD